MLSYLPRICRRCKSIAQTNGQGYCSDCKPIVQLEQASAVRQRTRFYDSPRWRAFRVWFLWVHWPREHDGETCCTECGLLLPYRSASAVLDHITPIEQGGAEYDVKNLQPLCQRCHNSKRGRERKK